jgi:uncharacterized protein (DUF58 family)
MSSVPPEESRPGSRFLRPQDLRRFRSFHFAAKLTVEGFYAGRHRSPYHDAAAEFADYRPYVPGDEIRALDWRAMARTDRDYIKLFRKETDMRCHVLLDSSRSMAFREETDEKRTRRGFWRRGGRAEEGEDAPLETSGLSKFEYGAYLTAALCYLMIRQGDKASLAVGGSDLRAFVPPGGTITHLYRLLHALERIRPDGPTQQAAVLRSLYAMAQRRGLLVVISDFLEEPGPLFDALAMFTYRGWQVLLFRVLTETELELPGDGPARYLDAEGFGMADADPDALRPAYRSELRAWFETLETQAKARRIRYQRVTTATAYDLALERYLTTRAAG